MLLLVLLIVLLGIGAGWGPMGVFALRSLELVTCRHHSADWHHPALDRPRAL
jgi:hypothetical protein